MLTDKSQSPLLITVAPNGARRTQVDHPKLPILPKELAYAAAECCEAGAAMLHLHVRNESGRHSLDPNSYRRALKEVESAVGDKMLIQVTSEAAGIYRPDQQMSAIRELAPRCVSIGLREIIADEAAIAAGAKFLSELEADETLIQYILYSLEDIIWYQQLCQQGVIPQLDNLVLLVLGRYGKTEYGNTVLKTYLAAFSGPQNWMVCAFGREEAAIMQQAIELGGHCRVGFENNLWMPDGSLAENNCALVKNTAQMAGRQQRVLADRSEAIRLHHRCKVSDVEQPLAAD